MCRAASGLYFIFEYFNKQEQSIDLVCVRCRRSERTDHRLDAHGDNIPLCANCMTFFSQRGIVDERCDTTFAGFDAPPESWTS